MKRTLSLVLALAMLLTACSFAALAEDERMVVTFYIGLSSKETATMSSLDESPTWQLIEDKLNVDIEWIHPTNDTEQFNLMVAQQEMYDIVWKEWTGVAGGPAQYIDNGLIMDLTDVIEEATPNYYNFMYAPENADILKQVTLNDGRMYLFARVFPDSRCMSYTGYIVRQDWLDELGIDRPTNIAEWEETLIAIKEGDLNGNGEADEIPFVPEGLAHIRPLAAAWGIRSGLYPSLEDGSITFGQIQPEYKEFLMKMNEWYQMGLIDPEFASNNGSARQQKMTTDLGGVFYGYISGGIGTILDLMKDVNPEYNLTAIPYAATEDGIAYTDNDPVVRKFVGQGCAISAKMSDEKKAKVFELFDYFYSDEGYELLNWGIEGITYTKDENGENHFTDYVFNNPDGLASVQAVCRYAWPNSNAPAVCDYEARKYINNMKPQQNEAADIWALADTSLCLPILLPTSEDSSRMSTLLNEINTYMSEMETKFIMGRESFDEYDNFVNTLYEMNVEELIEIEQRTYDAYIQK